ncbi:MAG: DNA methyltransferase [Chloroflexi bacterium RBG_13_46_14]|nr:MAG: DNA methyltransferase [Chloroflexi bacterium RBG_13_46_14]
MKEDIQLVEEYFRDLRDIHQSGAGLKETSYYGSIANLFNGIGKSLKPQVKCIIQLMNRGAGHPDGGFFTKEQWNNGDDKSPLLGQIPSRGVIEIKSADDDTWVTAESKQVSKYWDKYQLVLVTNYRDFVLVGRDASGNATMLESYHLADSEADFWMKAAHPKKFAQEHGRTFIEYLKRIMLESASLYSPRDLAWFLASYARTASARIESKDIPVMKSVRNALETALGLKFEGDKGEHFFRSTLVQTIFYGLFSAWVLWSKKRSYQAPDLFSWHDALWELKVPVMQALFGQIVTPAHVGPLELEDTLDWASSTLNRVDRASFFNAFEEGKAVQYFYEPFLEAFDPELRKQLGVWYTPPEIVQYMVSRVDTVLKEELDIHDGLADPSVFVLDPCCGTGSYLVEVLRQIYQTLKARGTDALLASDLKKAALERVFGFEILAAPFVVSHMQLGLLLQNMGAPLSDTNHERAGVYLTNALTGWEPLDPEKEKAFQAMLTGFPQLLEEQKDASKVKQQVPILVILGNPPYNAFAGTATTKEEKNSVALYKEGLIKKWGIKKFNLDDLYIRFFRMAERRIAEQTGRGVMCLISNFSYLSDPSFVVIRERFLGEFDRLWLDNLNGDSRETGKRTPEGKPDPSVFSTEYNKAGIRVGTNVSLLVRKNEREEKPLVRFRQFWGSTKRADLVNSLNIPNINSDYQSLQPVHDNRYSFRPSVVSTGYLGWPRLIDVFEEMFVGLEECRGGALIDIDKDRLEIRMQKYFDQKIAWDSLKSLNTGLTENAARFDAAKARLKILSKEEYDQSNVIRYTMRPFDTRWCYYTSTRPLWNEPRPTLYTQYQHGNKFLVSRMNTAATPEGVPAFVANALYDKQTINRNPGAFPLFIYPKTAEVSKKRKEQAHLIEPEEETKTVANLSSSARAYLASLGINPDADIDTASLIWLHALAIGYSPAYISENADGVRKDWPRIPLPNKKELLEASAELGEKIAALLDTEKPVAGVTASAIRLEIQSIAVISKEDGGDLQLPKELTVTVGWGHSGQNGVVMPGKGKVVERDYTPEEKEAISKGAEKLGITIEKAFELLGESTLDVYLNEVAYWKNVPVNVWEYHIGGYQVIKKWLSYREANLLNRPLTTDEAREVMNMARRIATLIMLQPALDNNYKQCKDNVYPWKQVE